MSRVKEFVDALHTLFAERLKAECIKSSEENRLLVIEDENNCSQFHTLSSDRDSNEDCVEKNRRIADSSEPDVLGFLLHNQQQKTLYLLSVDHCFFRDDDPSRCDCLVFEDRYLCFVELKLRVTSRRTRTRKLKEARDQLGCTIQFFKSETSPVSPNLFGFIPEAYAVMKTSVYPRSSSSRQNVFVQFLEEYGVKLYEANEKTF